LGKNPDSVKGWTSSNGALEIGLNSLYHRPSLGSGFVAYVNSGHKSFPRQNLVMKAGKYLLNFDWAPAKRLYGRNPRFQVIANGVCIKNIQLQEN
jgi:hypothetical protein